MVDPTQTKVLITGGLGNLGSWLTHYFQERDYAVTVLTKRARTLEFPPKYELLTCDIADAEQCRAALTERYDVILHTASMNDGFVDNYAADALRVNALGTRNILEAVRDHPPKHFIYLSTFHVYGIYGGPISEITEPAPLNDYGLTHLFAEYYVKQYHRLHGLPYSVIRLSNSYGCPRDYDSSKWYLILNDLSRMAYHENKIELRGNGLATRDFIWMGDVCRILHDLAFQEAPNDTFNLSGGRTYSLVDVAEAVQAAAREHLGRDIPVMTNTEDKSTPRPPLDIDNAKLKKRVSYTAEPHFIAEAKKIFDFLKKQA